MFESPDLYMDDLLGILAIEKIRYDLSLIHIYWRPPAYENLAACDGFYIEAEAVYTGDPYDDWEKFINTLSVKLSYREKTLEKICAWKPCGAGQSRYVVLRNRHVDIIADDADGYVAVYALSLIHI